MNNYNLNNAEEAIISLAESSGESESEIVGFIVDGFNLKYNFNLPENVSELIDELRATFNAY